MSIRINQQLGSPYNPDGTPGTVSTGAPGAPGRAPLPEEIYAAITQYVATNPITVPAVQSNTSESTRLGSGATGAPGSYVDLGSHGSLQGYVTAGGTPQTVNLYLQAKNGTVVADGPTEVSSTLSVRGAVTLHDNQIFLRENVQWSNYVGYQADTGTTLYGDTGGVGNGTNYFTWDASKFTFNQGVTVTGAVSAGSVSASSATVSGTVTLGTPVAVTDTAVTTAATEIKAATIRKTATNRRGFVLSELPTDCVINGQVDVLGVLATLWAQVKTLTP